MEVVKPAARGGIVIAALFCFILTFGDFVSPLYPGVGNPPTLSILITDTTKSGQQWPRAAVIALMMIATLLAIAFAAIRFAYRERGRSEERTSELQSLMRISYAVFCLKKKKK